MSKNSKYEQEAKIFTFNPTGEYYFTKGLKAYHRRDLYKAKRYLERAMELEPLEPIIACQLAIVCTDIGEYSYSNTILENIISDLDPFMSECHYFLANNFAHLGLFKDAYKHANKYLTLDHKGEFIDDAEDLLDLLTLESMDSGESLEDQDSLISEREEAKKYLEAGNFTKAIEVLQQMIEEHPDHWFAYNNLALAYFYSGKKEEAFKTVEEVLEKNPGNLHGLCNLVVFHHYEKNADQVTDIVAALMKVHPINFEQQYKLGATFALIGRFDLAYMWLKHLQKYGFAGDDTFYYWLSTCAYHLGYEQSAQKAWKKVIELNPEKAGLEPWGEIVSGINGFEHQVPVIVKKLESDLNEERLFGLFLYKHCFQKDNAALLEAVEDNEKFTNFERTYLKYINNENSTDDDAYFIDNVSELLYQQYNPISLVEAGLYFIWFSVWEEGKKEQTSFSNPAAWAGAVVYTWSKMRNEQLNQKEVAAMFGISVSTVQKYVKKVNALLH